MKNTEQKTYTRMKQEAVCLDTLAPEELYITLRDTFLSIEIGKEDPVDSAKNLR